MSYIRWKARTPDKNTFYRKLLATMERTLCHSCMCRVLIWFPHWRYHYEKICRGDSLLVVAMKTTEQQKTQQTKRQGVICKHSKNGCLSDQPSQRRVARHTLSHNAHNGESCVAVHFVCQPRGPG